jgi:predicted SprT family Zn-dependent metalloprotease
MTKPLTKSLALERLTALAQRFKVPVPRLEWSQRARYGQYILSETTALNPVTQNPVPLTRIRLGANLTTGSENALLHEFAHHVAYTRHGWLRGKKAHGALYTEILIDVVQAWYGDLAKYPWHREYKQVYDYVRSQARRAA